MSGARAGRLRGMARFLSVDLLAGLGAITFAVLGLTVLPVLGELVEPKIAGGFGIAALGRWYVVTKKKAKEGSATARYERRRDAEAEEDTKAPSE